MPFLSRTSIGMLLGLIGVTIFGGTLPNPVDGKLLGGLPLNR